MIDTRDPERRSRTFSRSYVAPELQSWLDGGGTAEGWLRGRVPLISYARISADRLDGESLGVARQHRSNTRSAEALGCAVVLRYEDNNLTAAKETVHRPAFRRMCQDLTHGAERQTGIPVRGCISVERERAYRLRRDFVALQDALVMAGGVFVEGSTVLDIDECDGQGQGAAETDRMRVRTARSRADRAEEGRVFAGPRRFGWLGASTRPHRLGNMHRNDEEWPHLLAMIKARAAGRSWRGIAGDMNRQGVRTARGGRWSEQGVKSLVANPAWWGGRILDAELVADPATGEPVIGEWDHVDEARDGLGRGTWSGIMDGVRAARLHRGLDRVQSEKASRTPSVMGARTYLFSGVLRCGRRNDLGEVCRSKLCGNKASGKNAKYGDYYRCGDPNCKGIGRRVAAVDAYLEGLVLGHLEDHFTRGTPVPAVWRGESKLRESCRTRQEIETSVAAGEAAWADVRGLLVRLNRNIVSLETERREHEEEQAKGNLLLGWKRERWGRLEVREKREVIARVLATVLVLPVPEGVSDKAPFDPTLLIPSWCREKAVRLSGP